MARPKKDKKMNLDMSYELSDASKPKEKKQVTKKEESINLINKAIDILHDKNSPITYVVVKLKEIIESLEKMKG